MRRRRLLHRLRPGPWLLLALLLTVAATSVRAEEPSPAAQGTGSGQAEVPPQTPQATPPQPATEPPAPQPRLPGMRYLDVTHDFFSRSLETATDRIDAFFGDERIYEEASGTYVRLSGSGIYGTGGLLTFDGIARMRVDLSNFGKKLHLLVASDEVQTDGDNITTGDRFFDRLDASNPFAALQLVLQETRYWDVRLQPGVKLRAPIDPFVKLRMRRLKTLGDKWLLRFTVVPGWYDSHGWELRSSVNFDHSVGKKSLLRFTTGANWQEASKKNVVLYQSAFYAYQLTPVVLVAGEAGVLFDTTPRLIDHSYYASFRLRRNLHQGWLFFETKPQVVFARENGFRLDPSLVLTLEMLIGERYL